MDTHAPARPAPFLLPWTVLLLALLALGSVLTASLAAERASLTAREQERLLSQARVVDRLVEQQLGALNSVLNDLREYSEGREGAQEMNHRLKTLVDALTGVRTLAVFDSKGFVKASSRPELIGADSSGRDYFKAVRDNPDPKRLFLSPPFRTSLGVYTMTLAKMITGPGGGFGGIVLATLDPMFFDPLLASVLYSPDMWAMLVHGGGTVFLVEPHLEDTSGKNLATPGSYFSKHMDSGLPSNVFKGRVMLTGEDRMLAVRTISPDGLRMDHPLVLGISRDIDSAMANWRARAMQQGALFALAAAVSVASLTYVQRRQRSQTAQLDRASRALEERERFIRTLTDNIPGMVGYWNKDLHCGYANKAYLEWFGRTQEQMEGISIMELLGERLFRKNEPYIRAALRGEPQMFERTLTKADGSTGYTLARYIPDADGGGVRGFFVLVTDVTALKTTQMELEGKVAELDILATTDPLTGIANRRHFLRRAEEEHERSKRYGHSMVFMMLDIDHFKSINDRFGHDAGDEVLKSLASLLRQTLRATDIVGRLGGEEFGAILVEASLEDARATAERLRELVKNTAVPTVSGVVSCTVSIGLSVCRKGDCSIEGGMKRADSALYDAKQTGRDKVSTFADTVAPEPE